MKKSAKKSNKIKRDYAVYDMKDSEVIVLIGSALEVTEYLKVKKDTMFCAITRKSLIKRRYLVERI